jgi:phosphoserine phosphatase
MRKTITSKTFSSFLLLALTWTSLAHAQGGRNWLPSWNEGSNRTALIEFVQSTTTPSDPAFVKPAERIAVFDNDGTLWAEQPFYFQLAYGLDRVRELAPQHPEWQEQMPFKAVLENDIEAALAGGRSSLADIVMASHTGNTNAEFVASVAEWIETARHPTTGRLYTDMVYQPMLELLRYLRANGYKTYIVSGGGIEFMRAFAERVYGIPPEQVIGSSFKTKYEVVNGAPALQREPKFAYLNDGPVKVVNISRKIGRRPVIAFGNSDGDFEMLEWTTAGEGPRLGAYIHHDDAEREWAYDRDSSIGRLERGLDEAGERGWLVVSMRDDWATVFPVVVD